MNSPLEQIDTKDLIQMRDAGRLADALMSIELWERQRDGKPVFKSGYSPDERLSYYRGKEDKYKDKTLKHGTQDILNLLGVKFSDTIYTVVKFFFKLIGEII